MASPQMYWQLTKNYLKRNNPVDVIVTNIANSLNELITFNSKIKLLKYKFMLARQQLDRMEASLNQENPYNVKGYKIDKNY